MAYFVNLGGVNVLFELIESVSGNTQGYALGVLRHIIAHNCGLKKLLQVPELIKELYNFTYSTQVISCRQAIELLMIISQDPEGSSLVHKVSP